MALRAAVLVSDGGRRPGALAEHDRTRRFRCRSDRADGVDVRVLAAVVEVTVLRAVVVERAKTGPGSATADMRGNIAGGFAGKLPSGAQPHE